MKKIIHIITTQIIILIMVIYNFPTNALTYTITEKNNRLIGQNLKIIIPLNNKSPLEYFAKKFQIGLSNLLEANPNIDVYLPQPGVEITIPHQLILPDTPHKGIIINSAEMRLYFYPENSNKIIIFPIGIGELKHHTPFNWTTSVHKKKSYPTWTPTQNIHNEYAALGKKLPKTINPGPNNPMGLHALYIGKLFAIHGTNANFGIGLRTSHGCVRLRNEDMEYLFKNVPIGTTVQFINEPVKIATEKNGLCYLEAHQPLSLTEKEFNSNQPIKIQLSNNIHKQLRNKNIDHHLVNQTLKERSGIPINITHILYLEHKTMNNQEF